MDAADSGARILIGGRGDSTGVQDDDFSLGSSASALHAAVEQLALNGRAIRLGRTASKILDMISRHQTIILGTNAGELSNETSYPAG